MSGVCHNLIEFNHIPLPQIVAKTMSFPTTNLKEDFMFRSYHCKGDPMPLLTA